MYPLSQSLHTSIYCIHWKNILQIFIMITSIYSCLTKSPLILKKKFLYSNHFVNILPPYQSHVWKLQYEWIKSSTWFFSLWYNWNSIQWSGQLFIVLLKIYVYFSFQEGVALYLNKCLYSPSSLKLMITLFKVWLKKAHSLQRRR